MYTRVYAPTGEPFDVTRDKADQLLLQEGWTQTCPTDSKKESSTGLAGYFKSAEPETAELDTVPEEEPEAEKPKRYSRKKKTS